MSAAKTRGNVGAPFEAVPFDVIESSTTSRTAAFSPGSCSGARECQSQEFAATLSAREGPIYRVPRTSEYVDPFYAVVRVIARFWIWFFFERVEVRHPERSRRGVRCSSASTIRTT